MGLTKKAKILLAGVAAALVLVAVIIPLVVLNGRQSIEAEGRDRLNNIDQSLQRSVRKMLDLVDQVEATASRRVAREVNMMELRDLEDSVDQLTRSLSDFAEMLNESGFNNIMARFQQDLQKYDQLLTEIQQNGMKINSELLEKIKVQETAFTEDESDLFKIETITRVQSDIAGPVVLAIGIASNKTKEILKVEDETANPALPVNQDNDTVIVLPTNETSTEETTVVIEASTEESPEASTEASTEESTEASAEASTEASTEVSSDAQAITEVTEINDEEQTAEPEVDRQETTAAVNKGTLQGGSEEQEPTTESERNADEEQSSQQIENLDGVDINQESDTDSEFETPIQTPDLSDID